MSKPAIKVEGLWKEYTVGAAQQRHGTFYDLLSHSLRSPLRRLRNLGGQTEDTERFWALRDMNFEIHQGEVVGVIGRNGAGKSTLLKILSRITAPSKGRIEVRGRLASLLEVGTGFHPELSGRENIFLNGAILGMSRDEVARKFDEIVAFAEIEKFIDTPVKRYSSGMYVRLAFAVAAHLEPDILIIDEVLAVGDSDFQQKCIGQMATISKAGRTLLVVSHNMQLIQKICRSAILLKDGNLVANGSVDEVQSRYLESAREAGIWQPEVHDSEPFQYDYVRVAPEDGYSVDSLPADRPFAIEFRFALRSGTTGRIAFTIRNRYGVVVFTSSDTDGEPFVNKRWQVASYIERCTIPPNLLVPGQYHLTISRPLAEGNQIIEDICCFVVDQVGSLAARDFRDGVIAPVLQWDTEVVR